MNLAIFLSALEPNDLILDMVATLCNSLTLIQLLSAHSYISVCITKPISTQILVSYWDLVI